MAFDGIICSYVVDELKNNILNGKINKIFEPNKNEIILGIYSNGKNYSLDVVIDSANYRINLSTNVKPNPLTAFNFCMVLRKHLIGSTIKKIYMNGLERVIYIDLDCYNELNDLVTKTLVIELMGKHSNIILIDSKNTIIDSLRHLSILDNSNRNIIPNSIYICVENKKIDFINLDFDSFYKLILSQNINNLSTLISNTFIGFSKFGIENILTDLHIDANHLEKNTYKKIYDYLKNIVTNKNDFICVLIGNNFYLKNLPKKDTLQVNFFIDDFYLKKETTEKFINNRNNILKLILNKVQKLTIKLNNINNIIKDCSNMDLYKLYGELIISNLYKIDNYNQPYIILENYYDNNNSITIPLDKSISPKSNAEKYFKKYKKLKNASSIVQIQKQIIQSNIEYFNSLINDINNVTSINELNLISKEISIDLSPKQNKTIKKEKSSPNNTPTKYVIDNFTILVGKNSKQNDYLTCSIADKNDLWFHTKDIPGSHVVLKLNNISNFPDSIIYKCATIAAYFSKAKLSQNVAVDYTFIKHVKKPNGAKPGMVIYTNNKTLYVNPKNPIEY